MSSTFSSQKKEDSKKKIENKICFSAFQPNGYNCEGMGKLSCFVAAIVCKEDVTEFETTTEGIKSSQVDQILLNGNNICMVNY